MSFYPTKTAVSIYLVLTGLALFSYGCHVPNGFESSNPTTSSMTASNAGNNTEVPKTGQRISYGAGDDGDLQAGKAWPNIRFTDHGDGTVTDRLTGLMWTINADKANGTTDWEGALSKSDGCIDGGYTDWRLPNRNELASLIDLGRFNPALPAGHPFTGVRPSYYWTSTTFANNGDHAWLIHFFSGFITHDDKAGTHYVWFVRTG